MRNTSWGWLLLGVLLLAGCGGFRLRPAQSLRGTVISSVMVTYGPQIPADRTRLLDRLAVPAEMQGALSASFPLGAGPRMQVTITEFRAGRYGPTRMHCVAQLVDPNGGVVAQVEADATGIMGSSRNALIQNVSQECVNQIASQL